MIRLKAIRITHQNADVSIRGKFSLSQTERARFYLQLKDICQINESLILSTCNRLEIYYVHSEDLNDSIIGSLCAFKGVCSRNFHNHFQRITDSDDAMATLYRVAIGLDSQVLGDQQIFGQVKDAYQESADLGFAQAFLHRLMHSAFYAHKQVCQLTKFKEGAASISYNAVKILKDSHKNSPILVVGAGKMGEDICKHLVQKGYTNVTLTNRTASKAKEIASKLDISQLPFEQLFAKASQYDVLFGAASGKTPLFNTPPKQLTSPNKHIIDVCLPRSFSPECVSAMAAVYHNLDDLGSLAEHALTQRSLEIPRVEEILATCQSELNNWICTNDHMANLKQFKETLEQLRKESLASYLHKADKQQRQLMEEFSKSVINKIVKLPALQLKQKCQKDQSNQLGNALNELFNAKHLTINKSNHEHLQSFQEEVG